MSKVRKQSATRSVTVETCREILQQADLTPEEAEEWIEHLYLFANIVTDVLVEREHARRTQALLGDFGEEHDSSSMYLESESSLAAVIT